MGSSPGLTKDSMVEPLQFRRALPIVAAAVVAPVPVPSSVTYVSPGHVGIVTHRAGGGVDKTPLGRGLHLHNQLHAVLEEYPTYTQSLVPARTPTEGPANDEINANSKEGRPLALDVSMSSELGAPKVPQLCENFRTELATIQHTCVRQATRQAIQEGLGGEAIADELLAKSIAPTLVQYELVKKWDGKMPTFSGGLMPLIQLPVPKP